jgi:hypothetical protein
LPAWDRRSGDTGSPWPVNDQGCFGFSPTLAAAKPSLQITTEHNFRLQQWRRTGAGQIYLIQTNGCPASNRLAFLIRCVPRDVRFQHVCAGGPFRQHQSRYQTEMHPKGNALAPYSCGGVQRMEQVRATRNEYGAIRGASRAGAEGNRGGRCAGGGEEKSLRASKSPRARI